jgi:hypothetical protein
MVQFREWARRSGVALRVALLLTILAVAFGGVTSIGQGASASSPAPTSIAKPCSSGYVHAVLSWGHKCLKVGQFCKVGNREYRRYGFYCPRSGHLRRR